METFRFKKFSVSHQNSFKIGTDAVLLGALTPITTELKHALDIGTGSGVIALMLLQRGISSVVGIETDPAAASEAAENVKNSIWSKQIQILCADFCDISVIHPLGAFDLIVSNPPFFSNSLKSHDNIRNASRHSDKTLPFDILIKNASILLSEKGLFCVILPVLEAEIFEKKAASFNLFPKEIHHIFSKPHKPESRRILMMRKQSFPQPYIKKTICIYNEDESYSQEYKQLTNEFYL